MQQNSGIKVLKSPATEGSAGPAQVHFLVWDAGKKDWVREYATLVSWKPHEAQFNIGGKEFVLLSRQDLTCPGGVIGNVLRFYAYKPDDGKYKELFALPASSLDGPEVTSTVEFPDLADKTRQDLIHAFPQVQKAMKQNDQVQRGFLAAFQDLANWVAEQAKLGQIAPGLQALLTSGAAGALAGQLAQPENASEKVPDTRPRVIFADPKPEEDAGRGTQSILREENVLMVGKRGSKSKGGKRRKLQQQFKRTHRSNAGGQL